MAAEDVQTNIRLPVHIKERLVAEAAKNNRSLSAEVTSRLEASLAEAADPMPRAETMAKLDRSLAEMRYIGAKTLLGLLETQLMDVSRRLEDPALTAKQRKELSNEGVRLREKLDQASADLVGAHHDWMAIARTDLQG